MGGENARYGRCAHRQRLDNWTTGRDGSAPDRGLVLREQRIQFVADNGRNIA